MRLSKKLYDLDDNDMICVGSASAFFFVGTVKDFYNDIDWLTKDWIARFKAGYRSISTTYENCCNSKPSRNIIVKRKQYNEKTRRMEDIIIPYNTVLQEWEIKKNMLLNSKQKANLKIETFEPFMQRKVIDSYNNIQHNATVIIVDGYEVAQFWFKHEYDKYKRRTLNG